MKVTFPHLGNTYIAAKILFDGLGVDYIIPPLCNKEALRIGSYYSPDEICLPFKIMIGNYIQSIKQGADTVIIIGSCGPCRFGEYCELQMSLLKKIGYDVNFIVIDSPKAIGKEEFFRRVGQVVSDSELENKDKIKAGLRALKAINLIDDIERIAHEYAGYEKINGRCKELLNECKREVVKLNNPDMAIELLKSYHKEIKKVELDKTKDPIKIALIGEIYTSIEPFANQYIEEKLMNYGVCTRKMLTPSWWVRDTALRPMKLNTIRVNHYARKYLRYGIGGYAKECVGEAYAACKDGFDGAIQIFPVGCMPEIVSKCILPNISKENNFPIMSLILDEMTGEAGYLTRIEAFIDLLERRREYALSRS